MNVIKVASVAKNQGCSLLIATLVILGFASAWAQDELPPDVRSDLIHKQVISALKERRLDDALVHINELKRLPVAFPTPLLWMEARAAKQEGYHRRAYSALSDYLKKADRSSSDYLAALDAYASYKADGEDSESRSEYIETLQNKFEKDRNRRLINCKNDCVQTHNRCIASASQHSEWMRASEEHNDLILKCAKSTWSKKSCDQRDEKRRQMRALQELESSEEASCKSAHTQCKANCDAAVQ